MTAPIGFPDELAAIAADDRVFDALAAGRHADDANDVTTLLADWRGELDCAAMAAPSLQEMPPPPPRWSRTRRHAVGATVAALTLAVSTGVAAAASGTTGPLGALHRALFGGAARTSATDAARAARVAAVLDDVATRVDTAKAAGGISDADRTGLDRTLDRAAAMIRADRDPPRWLQNRLDDLRAAVAALLPLVTPAAVPSAAPSADGRGGSSSGDGGTVSGRRDAGAGTASQQSGGGSDGTRSSQTTTGGTQPSDGSGSTDVESSPQPTQTNDAGPSASASNDSASSDITSSDG